MSKQEFLFQNAMKNLGSDTLVHIEDETKLFLYSKNPVDMDDKKYKAFISTVALKTYTSILFSLLSKVYENDYHKIAGMVNISLLLV